MKRFRYRFQRILEIKEGLEKSCRAEYAEIMSLFNKETAQLEYVNGVKNSHMRSDRGENALRFNIELLRTGANYSLMLHRKIEEQKQQIGQIESILEDKRKNLLEAEKERRIYEKLKERDYRLYLTDYKREERKRLDEVGERIHHGKLSASKEKLEEI